MLVKRERERGKERETYEGEVERERETGERVSSMDGDSRRKHLVDNFLIH